MCYLNKGSTLLLERGYKMPRGRKPKSASMPKMKEIKDIRKAKKIITQSNAPKVRGKKPMPKYALKITDDLYISYDSRSWCIVQKNFTINKTTGEYYPDKAFLWYQTLDQAIKGLVQYKIRVPKELKEIVERVEDIYKLIDARIPKGIKPKDLFSDYIGDDTVDEE